MNYLVTQSSEPLGTFASLDDAIAFLRRRFVGLPATAPLFDSVEIIKIDRHQRVRRRLGPHQVAAAAHGQPPAWATPKDRAFDEGIDEARDAGHDVELRITPVDGQLIKWNLMVHFTRWDPDGTAVHARHRLGWSDDMAEVERLRDKAARTLGLEETDDARSLTE